MHTQDEQSLEVICKGEQLLGKAKAIAQQIERQVRRVIGGPSHRSGGQGAERRQSRTPPPGGQVEAGNAAR
jgi:hypothetical protein